METFIAIVHVLTALTLIALVLLQDSKGGGGLGGALGGGGSNSILGATGGATLAQKLTRGAAVVFAITSIGLTTLANKRSSVIDDLPTPPAANTAPATATPPADATTAPAAQPAAPAPAPATAPNQ